MGKPIDSYGPAGAPAASKDDDDDFGDDLFGSDEESEEEDEEKKKRLEAYAAKKAKSKIIKGNCVLHTKETQDSDLNIVKKGESGFFIKVIRGPIPNAIKYLLFPIVD